MFQQRIILGHKNTVAIWIVAEYVQCSAFGVAERSALASVKGKIRDKPGIHNPVGPGQEIAQFDRDRRRDRDGAIDVVIVIHDGGRDGRAFDPIHNGRTVVAVKFRQHRIQREALPSQVLIREVQEIAPKRQRERNHSRRNDRDKSLGRAIAG